MPNILKELKLTELSLVDRPANPEAYAPVFKADSEKGELSKMDMEDMSAKMKERMKYYMEEKGMSQEDAYKACMSEMEKAWDENERLRKALLDEGFVIKADSIEKKAPVEYIEVEGEQVAKADIPEPILKRLEAAEKAEKEAAIEKRAEEALPNVKKDVAVKLVKSDLLDDNELLEFLRAVDAMFEKAMNESGETHVDADLNKASDKLEKMAKDYASEHKVSYEKGYAAVVKTEDGKALLKAMKEDK